MKKFYLINLDEFALIDFEENDIIDFEMPSFCSGDYQALVQKDDNGLYINAEHNYFDNCRDFDIIKQLAKLNKESEQNV